MTTPPVPLLSVARSLEPILSSTEQPGPAAASDSSWLTDKWDKFAHDEHRGSVIGNFSNFSIHRDSLSLKCNVPDGLNVSVQALRAAVITTAAWVFRNKDANDPPASDTNEHRSKRMKSPKSIFHACRFPDRVRDYTVRFVGPDAVESVVVVCKHHFFEVPMYHPDNSRDLSVAELATQFQFILDNAQKLGPAPGYGVLTATDRDTWFTNRQSLIALNPELHTRLLHRIEASAFLVALDDSPLRTDQDWNAAYWYGITVDGANRWFDKNLQFIVFKDGRSGFCGEHSRMNARAALYLSNHVNYSLQDSRFAATGPVDTPLPAPTTLAFAAPDANLSASLELAQHQFMFLVASQVFSVINIPGIGSKRIRALRASPDAFAQLVIQLAYYHRSDLDRPTFESYQTRNFSFGRFEECSSLSSESVAFCLSVMREIRWDTIPYSETVQDIFAFAGEAVPDANTLARLARAAIKRQSEKKSMNNTREVNRRLLELKTMHTLKDDPLSDILTGYADIYFEDWEHEWHSIPIQGYNFGSIIPDLLEIAYIVQENTLCFQVTSTVGIGALKMAESLNCSAKLLASLLEEDVDVNRRAMDVDF